MQEPSLSEVPKLQFSDQDLSQAADSSPLSEPLSEQLLDSDRLQSDIPLAGSLSVSDVLHPLEVEASISLETESPEPTIAGATSSNQIPQSHSLLAEVAELAPGGHETQISHLARYVDQVDPVNGEDLEKIFSIVRLQAATALATVKRSDLFAE